MEKQPDQQPGGSEVSTGVEPTADTLRAGHEESLAATRELAQQVEDAEADDLLGLAAEDAGHGGVRRQEGAAR